ncbi:MULTISPECIES: imidazole glycerol phosphate synthase subunit HisF [unclassified Sphingomonas]|uniref:imidazole glycerol phosphate synthase subunit HisF n=1 Tax=unclassified Sphingomonas TaxID=196159 RepID=UPI0006F9C7C3|nr:MULTISPECIES: imidazole glycerol phosphate synthase cyclase subunit [unclassified Sphingomonas]KQX19536.1 imidazole glycerol phosphate synthase subunit HisF [Sphingomonas sp. Root1294]KQY65737.1 imidazole glycerol phosphate synthase subunit HisF [Sphingomonas sp. Root50]KRB94958.1 imidazole glycerol phosphate synthase subunit HisF [Sphingomonas sp. Root720]
MRVVARIDVKNEWVIKGIHLEGLRKVGEPVEMAKAYYDAGIQEIMFMDAVASLYDRNNLFHIIERACENVFVPIAIGGGLRSLGDVAKALDAGADKVVINTGAVRNIQLVTDIATRFGSQCIIGSIEAKRTAQGWEAYIDNGREPTGLDVMDWARRLEDAGIGELLITSIDQEGTKRGFDVALIEAVHGATSRPIIVSGGYGAPAHLDALFDRTDPSAIAFASALHYREASVDQLLSEVARLMHRDVPAS